MILSHEWPPRLPEAAREQVQARLDGGCTGWKCPGGTASLVKRQNAGGVWLVQMQCDGCGKALGGGAMKRDLHPNWASYPEWDDSFRAFQDAEAVRRQAEWQTEIAERDALREGWWDAYDEYLFTDVWQDKRQAVLRRANWTCEGCGVHRATQAHHLRYPRDCLPGSDAWIRQEKLFDLVAVCRQCHDDLHPRGDA
jgi:ribosomal protein L37AE/L43A